MRLLAKVDAGVPAQDRETHGAGGHVGPYRQLQLNCKPSPHEPASLIKRYYRLLRASILRNSPHEAAVFEPNDLAIAGGHIEVPTVAYEAAWQGQIEQQERSDVMWCPIKLWQSPKVHSASAAIV